jgi:hypothetical protein
MTAAHTGPVPFEVLAEEGLRRDPADGFILEEQAIALALAEAPKGTMQSRAVLIPLGDTGLFTWTVLFRVQPKEGPARVEAVSVDPYVGRVRPLALEEGLDPAAAFEEADPGKEFVPPAEAFPGREALRARALGGEPESPAPAAP